MVPIPVNYMRISDWINDHRLYTVSLAAATVYFLFVPLTGLYYHEFHQHDFIILHTVTEAISIIIAFMCFGVTFHSHKLSKNTQDLFLGVAFLSIGVIDIVHTLSYLGMPDMITPNTVNKATQLWMAARLTGAAAFFAAALISGDRELTALRPYPLLAAGLTYAVIAVCCILFLPNIVPAMFVPGSGLTPLKVYLEYAIVAAHAATILLLYRTFRRTGAGHLIYFMGALAMGIYSELLFTLYASPYDIYNLMGHVYKMGGYLCIYAMLFVTSVERPYSELTNAKDLLRDYAHHLEDKVLERTLDLVDKNAELLRLSRLKTDFLAMCSHDMKNPLQTNNLIIDMLLEEMDGPLNDRQRRSLEMLQDNEEEQYALITNLLDLARREQGAMSLNAFLADVSAMVEAWERRLMVPANDKGIVIETDIEDGLTAMLDEFKVAQVLNNLGSNALKFTPRGGVIRLFAGMDNEGALAVRMFNSGEAIPATMLENIFDKYIQVADRRKAAHEGVGLGLNIAKGHVELHGGRIWAESEEGVGNTFCFTLPGASPKYAAEAAVPQSEPGSGSPL